MTQPTYTSGLLFTKAHKAVRGRIYALLETHDLTPSHWAVIGITAESPEGVRLATVAREMEVKAPLVTLLADELIEKGLINRVAHHTDGRAKLLVMTAKGKKLATEIEWQLSSEIGALMTGVSAGDASSFQKTLETIIKNATAL